VGTDDRALAWGALMPGVAAHPVEGWLSDAVAQGVESVCLFSESVGSPERTRETVRELRAISPDLLIATDEEGGEVTRLEPLTGSSVLSPLALGVIDDVNVTRATGRLLGRMLRAADVDWTLAPVADVNVDPRNPVIGVRSFGSDSRATATHVAAMIDGLQSTGVLATAKHFPGHGDTHVDSHEHLPTLEVGAELIDQRELAPFRAAIDVGVATVMTGHLLVPALDPDQPASMSRRITTDLLRDQLGFEGVVITDAVEMGAVAGADRAGLPAAVVAALHAGADVVCLGAADQRRALEASAAAVLGALADGTLSRDLLAAAASRRQALRARRTERFVPSPLDGDAELIARAAALSLSMRGDARLSAPGVDVLRISASPGYAAGQTRWGVEPHLTGFGIDAREVEVVPAATGRDLVIEIRDAWKSTELTELLQETARRRPDAVIVDAGWPSPELPPVRGSITTHGSGNLASLLAACQLADVNPYDYVRSALTTLDRELT
jgi:beta-N-acetylhexosaminidase